MFGYTVTTDVVDDKIIQEVRSEAGRMSEVIICKVCNTLDQQTRDALISLGWTPPPVKP